MLKRSKKGFYVLEKFAKIDGLLHGFSSADFGNMKVLENRNRFARAVGIAPRHLVSVNQRHGKKIFIVGPGSSINQTEEITADGLITNQKNIGLLIKTADCLPVLLFDPKKEVIGLIHGGRKGTSLGVHLEALSKMKEGFDCDPEDLLVGLGPAICPHCYDKIDLTGSVLADYKEFGIKEENIEESKICTFENPDFYSHRRGEKARFAAILCLK